VDLAEDHAGGWARIAVEWPTRDEHGTGDNPHVWFEVTHMGRRVWTEDDGRPMRQCPCGAYEQDRWTDLENQLRLAQGEYMIARTPASLDEEPDEAELERLRSRCVELADLIRRGGRYGNEISPP
jgi:hypothetical protein